MSLLLRRIPVIFLLSTLAVGLAPASTAATAAAYETAKTISGHEMLLVIDELASPTYQGRLTGQPGQLEAAELVAGFFSETGLLPLGDDGGYFQYFTAPSNIIKPGPEVQLFLGVKTVAYDIGEQYLFRGYTGEGDVTAPICFAGYGITDDQLGYDDYSGIDVTGKWVLCLRGWHPAYPADSFRWSYTGWKARNAHDHGAVGLLLVSAHSDGTMGAPIGSYLYGLPAEEMYADFPMVHVGRDFVMDLFNVQGWYLPSIIGMIDKGEPHSFDFPGGTKARVKVEREFSPEAWTGNVIGYIPGADPQYASRAVVVCAHHDHVGYQDTIRFPGSNDNASGTAALMAIAKAMVDLSGGPARSVIFISFTGEEMGLLGSKYFVNNPAWEIENIDYVINMDMIAQGTELLLWGGTDFPGMRKLFTRLCDEYEVELNHLPPYPVSDHGPFVDKGIEAVMLLAGGEREYNLAHVPHVYKSEMIDVELLEKITKIAFVATCELAERGS